MNATVFLAVVSNIIVVLFVVALQYCNGHKEVL